MIKKHHPTHWYVYLLHCRNGALYSGITTNPRARFAAHLAGKGAKYTRMHPPLEMRIIAEHHSRSAASQAEAALKKQSAAQKRILWTQSPRLAHD